MLLTAQITTLEEIKLNQKLRDRPKGVSLIGLALGKKIAPNMVEETSTQNKPRVKTTRPKQTRQWTVNDVAKWYKRHCSDYGQYLELFLKHEITGRALLRISDHTLERMGIINVNDREAIWRQIVKQRLKTDIMEIRDMERIIKTY